MKAVLQMGNGMGTIYEIIYASIINPYWSKDESKAESVRGLSLGYGWYRKKFSQKSTDLNFRFEFSNFTKFRENQLAKLSFFDVNLFVGRQIRLQWGSQNLKVKKGPLRFDLKWTLSALRFWDPKCSLIWRQTNRLDTKKLKSSLNYIKYIQISTV